MPNLVAYLHVRLNLNIAEDAEIYQSLTKLPEGERSRMVRIALLAYFKGSFVSGERRTKRTKTRQAEIEPAERPRPIPSISPQPTPVASNQESQTTTKNSSEAALSEMLDLIQ